MKILHLGLTVNKDKNIGLSKAFRDVCEVYEEFPISVQLPNQIRSINFIPDIVFCQIHHDKIDNRPTNELLRIVIQELRDKGSFVINWNGDIRGNYPMWMMNFPADLTCFTNKKDIDWMLSMNKAADFLQIGIDTETFKRWSVGRGHDVVFMGNHYGNFPLSGFRHDAARVLKIKYGAGLYGNYPGSNDNLNPDPRNPFPKQSKESQIYSCSKIAVSISHFNIPLYTSDRLFRCMGSGCFTLALHYPGIEDSFEIGKHLDTFDTLQEMQHKIDFYLKNEELREQIAETGYQHVQKNFSYHAMVKNIIGLWEKY